MAHGRYYNVPSQRFLTTFGDYSPKRCASATPLLDAGEGEGFTPDGIAASVQQANATGGVERRRRCRKRAVLQRERASYRAEGITLYASRLLFAPKHGYGTPLTPALARKRERVRVRRRTLDIAREYRYPMLRREEQHRGIGWRVSSSGSDSRSFRGFGRRR